MDSHAGHVDRGRSDLRICGTASKRRASVRVAVGADFLALVGNFVYRVWCGSSRDENFGLVAAISERGGICDRGISCLSQSCVRAIVPV